MLHDGANVLQRQRTKLVLLQKIVKVLFQQFKDQTSMILVLEALVRSDEIEFIGIFLAQSRQDINLNLTLAGIRRVILQDFDGYHFVGTLLPAFHHLKNKKTPSSMMQL